MFPRAALAIVTIVCVGLGEAAAQYAPSSPFPPRFYRDAPPPDDDGPYSDDDGPYIRTVPAPRPYQSAPLPPPGMEARPQDPRFAAPDTTGSLGIPRRPFFASRDGDEFVPRPPGAVGAIGAPADAVPPAPNVAALPPDEQPEIQQHALAPRLRRQTVEYNTKEKPGTIIIDTQHTYLYLVLGRGQAMRYGIGVGRSGFTWSGREKISRMAEWPDWYPPEDMIERQPELPRVMAGGPGNPLGARALYLGNTLYRIHGTNQPSTIGKFVSSGCIRMLNEDAIDLYGRVKVGTRVVVLPGRPSHSASRK